MKKPVHRSVVQQAYDLMEQVYAPARPKKDSQPRAKRAGAKR